MEISIEHLSKNYGRHKVLEDVTLSIPQGMFGLLGGNGSGKTTLMRILATVLDPTGGRVRINGVDLKEKKAIRRIVGYLPQEFSMYPRMSVYSALDYLGLLAELPAKVRRERIQGLLEQVNLEQERSKPFGRLSGGMRRRFGIAQALLNDPQVLILDEPTAGLDPDERLRFYRLLRQLSAGRIILMSTHVAADIEATCQRAAFLSAGRVVFQGETKNLKEIRG